MDNLLDNFLAVLELHFLSLWDSCSTGPAPSTILSPSCDNTTGPAWSTAASLHAPATERTTDVGAFPARSGVAAMDGQVNVDVAKTPIPSLHLIHHLSLFRTKL